MKRTKRSAASDCDFGFFRPQFEPTLWPLVPQWLVIPRDSPQSP